MIDPNFNPLEELRVAQENINALCEAVNNQARFIEELAGQHKALATEHHRLAQSLTQAHAELRKIKGLPL